MAITDFNFSHLTPKLFHDMIIMDSVTHEMLTDKFHIMLCSLPEVAKTWEGCKSDLEKALFLIKNMEKMDRTSLAYREGNFNEFFEAARSSRLSKDDIIPYKQSLEYLQEVQRGIHYMAEQIAQKASAKAKAEGKAEGRVEGRVEGIAEGMAKGMAEGERKMLNANVARMRSNGFSDKDIAKILDQPLDLILSI